MSAYVSLSTENLSSDHLVGDTNKHRYVVATQSQPLRAKLRAIPATPLVHVNRSVMVLEPPSDATLRAKALVGLILSFAFILLTA